jgi:hypothetical protein
MSSVPRTRLANRTRFRIRNVDLTRAIELFESPLMLTVFEQSDSHVVTGKSDKAVVVLQSAQYFGSLRGATGCDQDIRLQEIDFTSEAFGDLSRDSIKRLQRFLQLILLKVDPRQPIGCLVTHHLFDIALQYGRNRSARTVMHAVVEFEIADGKLRVIDVIIQRIEERLVHAVMLRQLGVEPFKRIEVEPLLGIEDCFAKVEILQLRLRILRQRGCGKREARKHEQRSHDRSPVSHVDRGASRQSGKPETEELRVDLLGKRKSFAAAEVIAVR